MQKIKDDRFEELIGYTFTGATEGWVERLRGYAREHEIDLHVQINNPERKPPASVQIRAMKSRTFTAFHPGQH
jgi:hypothetical protein